MLNFFNSLTGVASSKSENKQDPIQIKINKFKNQRGLRKKIMDNFPTALIPPTALIMDAPVAGIQYTALPPKVRAHKKIYVAFLFLMEIANGTEVEITVAPSDEKQRAKLASLEYVLEGNREKVRDQVAVFDALRFHRDARSEKNKSFELTVTVHLPTPIVFKLKEGIASTADGPRHLRPSNRTSDGETSQAETSREKKAKGFTLKRWRQPSTKSLEPRVKSPRVVEDDTQPVNIVPTVNPIPNHDNPIIGHLVQLVGANPLWIPMCQLLPVESVVNMPFEPYTPPSIAEPVQLLPSPALVLPTIQLQSLADALPDPDAVIDVTSVEDNIPVQLPHQTVVNFLSNNFNWSQPPVMSTGMEHIPDHVSTISSGIYSMSMRDSRTNSFQSDLSPAPVEVPTSTTTSWTMTSTATTSAVTSWPTIVSQPISFPYSS